ncbi:GNAT family N-acetyltransferase [Nonomuraea sp. NPDC050328]|uniref:GNAT family N-acetyltransferase n=1 Tax=Nonomuraea sp. NPDC050328 TaxID=3364361 RepID=UPI0037A198BB
MTPERRLEEHLARWLGQWPPPAAGITVVGEPRRLAPGWDGRLHPVLGVARPGGDGVLSVPPPHVAAVTREYGRPAGAAIPELVGFPGRGWFTALFRWSAKPAELPDTGVWVPADGDGVPAWLRPFGGEVLVARDPDTGEHLAGVGVKRHDEHGHELAVVTEPQARGRGLARTLVAQAARRVLDEGAVPTYLHDPGNHASAATADSAGFPDLGWTAFGLTEARE